MPAQRVSKSFKDLSMSFKFNPLSGDLIALKNENAIARAVRNIVLTTPGEKLFDPDFKVSTVYYQVENGHDRDGLGSEENYFWKTAKERSDFSINVEADPNIGAGNTAIDGLG